MALESAPGLVLALMILLRRDRGCQGTKGQGGLLRVVGDIPMLVRCAGVEETRLYWF